MAALARLWSMAAAPLTPMDPADGNKLLLNALLAIRYMAYDCALVATNLPASMEHLLTDGSNCGYDLYTELVPALQAALVERGVSVPSFPACMPRYAEEATADAAGLVQALLPHLEPAMADWLKFFRSRQLAGDHWSSFAAFHWITWAYAHDGMVAVQNGSAEAFKGGGVMTYNRMLLEDPKLRDYSALLLGDRMKSILALMDVELPKARAAAAETGWREDEAKTLVVESFRFSGASYDVSLAE